MAYSLVRVTPDPKYSAEVVVLLTTLRAKRTEYNSGKRVKDMLEIKRVHYKAVDFNRDARQAGSGEVENLAIQKLLKAGKLMTDDDDGLILPQIFVDGQYVGGMEDLQGLEDDDRLEIILKRQDPNWKVEEILPGMLTIEATLANMARTSQVNDYDDSVEDSDEDSDEYEDDDDEKK